MKIAIPIPSPVPFAPGGIEKLAAGLADALAKAGHQVEIIKVPAPERTCWQIIFSYVRLWRLDLRHFDLVISLKYPGWMCRSNRHIVYMCHRLRGLYDTYPLPLGAGAWLSKSLLRFPGPLIRRIVHLLDQIGLSSGHVSHFFCLSETVKRRADYFPAGCYEPVVLRPPTSLAGLMRGDYAYFFAVSRLDAPKRMDLVISAMAHVKEDVRLLIAGEGPQRSYLESLAASDPRIVFLGSVTDEELARLYKDALAMLFVPIQEDFGLVTVEAMRCAKPVITCRDSGGPTELVRDGVNGFVCSPESRAIAEKMSLLAQSRDTARELGKKGLETVSGITWENVVSELLKPYNYLQLSVDKFRQNKRVVCVLSPYGIYPPVGGGKARIFQLYRRLARYYNIVIVSVGNYNEPYQLNELSDGLFEVRVPMTPIHSEKQWGLERAAGLPISDVAMPRLIRHSPMIKTVVDHFIQKADVVVASHPFLFDAMRRVARTRLVVYEAHNVETTLKKDCLKGTRTGRGLLRETRRVEKAAARLSDVVWATSEVEAQELASLFGIGSKKVWVVPNAVDTNAVCVPDARTREKAREELGCDGLVALFIASWHPPNLDGLLFLKEHLSPALPDCKIVVVGSVKDQYSSVFKNLDFPDNLKVLGVIDEKTKNRWLAAADVAINPVAAGSGTSLKMFDYMAADLPIVTTTVGARGTGLIDGEHAILCEPGEFAEKIRHLYDNPDLASALGAAARKLAEDRFDWSKIADALHVRLEEAMPSPLPREFEASDQQHFISGWYPVESWESKFAFRWSNGEGRLEIHNPKRDAVLRLELLKGASPELKVVVNDSPLAELALQDGWQLVEVRLPRIIDGDAIRVQLSCKPWRPADVDGGDDFRRLGIALRQAGVA